jgi:hypothetical protein
MRPLGHSPGSLAPRTPTSATPGTCSWRRSPGRLGWRAWAALGTRRGPGARGTRGLGTKDSGREKSGVGTRV